MGVFIQPTQNALPNRLRPLLLGEAGNDDEAFFTFRVLLVAGQ